MQRLGENVLHCLHLHSYDDDNHAGSLQEAITDAWHEKFSNVNVTMRNVNIAV